MKRILFAPAGMFIAAAVLSFVGTAVFAQGVIERPSTVRVDICPAPELVNAHIVLDVDALHESYSGPVMRVPRLGGITGSGSTSTPTIIPTEPGSTDDVLSDFRQDYGLDVPATEFLFASVAPLGSILCHYRSDVVEPVISIRTNSATCSVTPNGAWTQVSSSVMRCDEGRRSCSFLCAE